MSTRPNPAPSHNDPTVDGVYERLYRGRGQRFEDDAARLARRILMEAPHYRSLLDVGCGTGAHLREMSHWFPRTIGVDASPRMCRLASCASPRSSVLRADMADLPAVFRENGTDRVDVVMSLTSTVAYAATFEELCGLVQGFADLLAPGGLLVLDPWWTPEQFDRQRVVADEVFAGPADSVSRMTACRVEGHAVEHRSEYLLTRGASTLPRGHSQRLHLYSRDQYLASLTAAGLHASHTSLPGGFAHRGLFTGRNQKGIR